MPLCAILCHGVSFVPLCATESHLCHFVPRSLICAILCHGVPFVPFCATEFHLCHNAQKRPEEIQHQLGFLPAGICKSIPYLINLPCCFPYSRKSPIVSKYDTHKYLEKVCKRLWRNPSETACYYYKYFFALSEVK